MTEFPSFPLVYHATHRANNTALIWEKGNSVLFSKLPSTFSWKQLQALCYQTLQHLSQHQFKITDQVVAYCGTDRLAGLIVYLSVLLAGGKILILNPAFPNSQRQMILQELGITQCISDEHFADFSPKLTACSEPCETSFNLKAPATLTLTSGSSGNPKAVVHSLNAHLQNAQGVCELMQFESLHRWILSLPLFHVSGQGIIWRWLCSGAELAVYQDKADFYSVLANCSHASLVPTQLQRYLEYSPVRDGQKILLGGSHIPQALIEQAQQAKIDTFAGYGMTEAASTICAVQHESDNVGKPLSGREVKIVDGQIYIKGDILGLGYWQNGQIQPFTTKEGWFATKDRGEWKQGKLHINGRMDNLFISGGENIQPEQVETVLFRSGLLQRIVIVPQQDKEFGQRPVAFIEPFSLQTVEKLRHFAKSELVGFQQPINYYPLPSQLDTGIKISRKALQNTLAQLSNNGLSQ